jgi:hypothetical protein
LRTVLAKNSSISFVHAAFFLASFSDAHSLSRRRRSGAMPPEIASRPWQRAQFWL